MTNTSSNDKVVADIFAGELPAAVPAPWYKRSGYWQCYLCGKYKPGKHIVEHLAHTHQVGAKHKPLPENALSHTGLYATPDKAPPSTTPAADLFLTGCPSCDTLRARVAELAKEVAELPPSTEIRPTFSTIAGQVSRRGSGLMTGPLSCRDWRTRMELVTHKKCSRKVARLLPGHRGYGVYGAYCAICK